MTRNGSTWWVLPAALLALSVGCRSTDPRLLSNEGVSLKTTDPVSYRLAVAPVEIAPAFKAYSGTGWKTRTEKELQDDLIDALRDFRTASDVFPLESTESFEAYKANADLMLRPRLEEASFGHRGPSGRAVLSSLLWITTWISSLWVEDTEYNARMVVHYDLVDPHTGISIVDDLEIRSDQASLAFWDRNEAFSKGFFLTMLVPPFLTSDDKDRTGEAIYARATDSIAAQVKAFLTEQLPSRERELLADVQVRSPRNGSTIDGPTPLRCDVVARRVVTEIVVLVNDQLYQRWKETDLPSFSEQNREGYFVCPIRLEEVPATRRGKNIIRVLVNVAGQWASRSILLYNGAPDESAASEEEAPGATEGGALEEVRA